MRPRQPAGVGRLWSPRDGWLTTPLGGQPAVARQGVAPAANRDEKCWDDEQRNGGREREPADDGESEWPLQLTPGAESER
jgi:hypothetical protein